MTDEKTPTTPPRRRGRAPEGECRYCDEARAFNENFHPPHDASPNCESGGHNHCTCDTCF